MASLQARLFPGEVADRITQRVGRRGVTEIKFGEAQSELIAQDFKLAVILFADIVGFTTLSSRLGATRVVTLLNQIFCQLDDLAEELGLYKVIYNGGCGDASALTRRRYRWRLWATATSSAAICTARRRTPPAAWCGSGSPSSRWPTACSRPSWR